MMIMRQASEAQELHLNCHNEFTMWILYQVELLGIEALADTVMLSGSDILVVGM